MSPPDKRNDAKYDAPAKWREGRWFAVLFLVPVLVFACLNTTALFAQNGQSGKTGESRSQKRPADTYDATLQDALKKIPWSELTTEQKSKIKPVIGGHSIFRRMPQQAVYTDPEVYQFLVRHPDVVVGFWEKLGVTQISLKELGDDRFLLKETGGTTAVAEVLYRSKDVCVVYAKGQYIGPFFAKSIDGESVLILRTRFLHDEDDEPYVISQLDSFVRIENSGADLIAKLLANVVGKIADSNFEQTIAFVGNVSEASTFNTNTVKRHCAEMKGVRKSVRSEFLDMVDRVAVRGRNPHVRELPERTEYAGVDYSASARAAEIEASTVSISQAPSEGSTPKMTPSIPVPTIAKLPQRERRERQPLPEPVAEHTPEIDATVGIPIPIGVSTLGSETTQQFNEPSPFQPNGNTPLPVGVSTLGSTAPKSGAVFRSPKVAVKSDTVEP